MVVVLLAALPLPGQKQEPQPSPPSTATPIRPDDDIAKTAGAPVDLKSYVMGPEDVLLIRVWREAELSGPVVVRPDNNITLPLIGDVVAGGLTPAELKAVLQEKLSQFINKPDVLVVVQAVRSKTYLISGEVGGPGRYPLVLPTTVLEAIVGAGGLREYANKKNIIIMRGAQRLKFNYKEVIDGKKLEQNILLQPGDHILVK
jgi:polysaccharide export outer membrane protein